MKRRTSVLALRDQSLGSLGPPGKALVLTRAQKLAEFNISKRLFLLYFLRRLLTNTKTVLF